MLTCVAVGMAVTATAVGVDCCTITVGCTVLVGVGVGASGTRVVGIGVGVVPTMTLAAGVATTVSETVGVGELTGVCATRVGRAGGVGKPPVSGCTGAVVGNGVAVGCAVAIRSATRRDSEGAPTTSTSQLPSSCFLAAKLYAWSFMLAFCASRTVVALRNRKEAVPDSSTRNSSVVAGYVQLSPGETTCPTRQSVDASESLLVAEGV